MSWLASLRNCLCAWLAVAGTAALPATSPASPQAAHALERAVDTYLAPLLRTNNFAGVVLIARGDEILLQKGYGEASVEQSVPNSPATVFHIASVSKPFTAAAILRLAERELLDVHAPLSRLLPGYPNGDSLTVHHLLSHTSGIPNINDFPEYDAIQYRPHDLEELISYLRDRPLNFRPGERYEYSNSNYNLLAHIIERVSGVSYGAFLRREILDPLRLASSGHHASMTQIIPRLANGYAPAGVTELERARYLDWSVKTGNGSLYATAVDVVAFFRGMHTGRLLNPRSMEAAFAPHTPNVGYGWFLTTANGRAIHHINGRSPGWAAQADYYLDDEVTVVVLSNIYSSVTTPVARAIGAIYFGEAHQPLPDLSPTAPSPEAAARLVGTYRMGADYYVPNQELTIARGEGGHLFATPAGGAPIALVPVGAARFILRPFWIEAEFGIGAGGRASEIRIDGFRGGRTDSTGAAPTRP